MNNQLISRLMSVRSEIERLKTAKEKAAILLHTIDYQLEIELTLLRPLVEVRTSNRILVTTLTKNGSPALVSMFYDGDEDEERVFDFQRYFDFDKFRKNEMSFVVSCVRFAAEDDDIPVGGSKVVKVPLRIISTSELDITTEIYNV